MIPVLIFVSVIVAVLISARLMAGHNQISRYNLPSDLVSAKTDIRYIKALQQEVASWRLRLSIDKDERYQKLIDHNQAIIDDYNKRYGCKKYRLHVAIGVFEILHSTNYETQGYYYCDTIEEVVSHIKKLVDFDFIKNHPDIEKDLLETGLYPRGLRHSGLQFILHESSQEPVLEEYLYYLRT